MLTDVTAHAEMQAITSGANMLGGKYLKDCTLYVTVEPCVGSGPAGYTAAIYASRANLNPVLYTGMQMGGQLTTTTEVENFPGYPEGVTGPVMMEDMRKQAERFGTDIRFGIATDVDFSGHPHKVTIDGEKVIEADAVIIATG